MYINSISDFRKAVRNGPYAWPGGYPLHFVCDDGGILCCACVKAERRNMLESIARGTRDGWRVVGMDVNWEDAHMECGHCGTQVESAYAEPEDETGAPAAAIEAKWDRDRDLRKHGD